MSWESHIKVYILINFIKRKLVQAGRNSKNLKLRKFIAETQMEFYEFAEDMELLPRNKRNNKTELYNKFIDEYQDFKKWLQVKTFVKWIDKYCKYKEFEFLEGNTQGNRWFEIVDKNLETEEDNDIIF